MISDFIIIITVAVMISSIISLALFTAIGADLNNLGLNHFLVFGLIYILTMQGMRILEKKLEEKEKGKGEKNEK